MNEKQLFHALGDIDDEIIERSEKTAKKTSFLKFLIPAACLCLVTAVGVAIFKTLFETNTYIPDVFIESENMPVSDSYKNLTELLEQVSKTEEHNNMIMGSDIFYELNTDDTTDNITSGLQNYSGNVITTDKKYSYHITELTHTFDDIKYTVRRINISKIDGDNTELVGYIPITTNGLMLYGDYLITVGAAFYEDAKTQDEFGDQRSSCSYAVYDISAPEKPQLKHIFTQSGRMTECWMVGERLYIVSGDGVCVCDYGSDNPEKYYPFLKVNEKDMEWNDEDITIIGKPRSVYYTALSIIDITTGEIIEKEAMYGAGSSLFYGDTWIATSVGEPSPDGYSGNPFLYLFDGDFNFTGKINIAKAANLDEQFRWGNNSSEKDGDLFSIISVKRIANEYRILLKNSHYEQGKEISKALTAVSVNTTNKKSSYDSYEKRLDEEYYLASTPVTEILWENDRAIIVTKLTNDKHELSENCKASFLIADFNSCSVTIHDTELTADYLYKHFGSDSLQPGDFDTLIPMGNSIYLRYVYHNGKASDGFDIFDFSDSASPKQLYKAEGLLDETSDFDFFWRVYDKDTFGVLDVAYIDNDYQLRWSVYDLNIGSDKPFTLVSKTDIVTESYFRGAGIRDFNIFSIGNTLYYSGKSVDYCKPIK